MKDRYSEANGEVFFDWNVFLAVNPEEYDDETLEGAMDRANDWVCCACGNLCRTIPRDHVGAPKDPLLYELGMDFASSITAMREYFRVGDDVAVDKMQRESRETLIAIENRSIEILQQRAHGK